MGTVTKLADYRSAKQRKQEAPPPAIPIPERTAELAFVLAIVDALSPAARRKALRTVVAMGDRCPNCEASQRAANLAACLTLGAPK